LLDRDDEVAVAHGSAEDGYRARSEAMVNIRRTLQAAQDQGIISAATRQALTLTGTALFYPERTWPHLLATAEPAGADAAELGALRRWLPAGRIDQQADDAVAMLREMRCFLAADPAPQQVSWTMANTARWEAVRRRADLMPATGPDCSPVLLKLDQQAPQADIDGAEEAAIAWYFAERLGTAVPADLAGYARSAGFPDEQAFRTAVRQEHRYTATAS
jgi:TfuA-like protein